MITQRDLNALKLFTSLYPDWWYRIGVCDVSRDFTAAPLGHSVDAKHIEFDNEFDNGFDCMHEGDVADAISSVMVDIAIAIAMKEQGYEKHKRHGGTDNG